MKDNKRVSIGVINSPEKFPNNNVSNSYTTFKKQIRRTLGSEQDDDKITWNISVSKSSPFYSPPKSRPNFQQLRDVLQQNLKLKEEIKKLKQLLIDNSKYSKHYELDATSKSKRQLKNEQLDKLKKIIEKSYYSIKQMQQQIHSLTQKLINSSRNMLIVEKKNKLLQFQKQDLENKIKSIIVIHKKQLESCNQKIRKLQSWIEHLNNMIEQDKKNWQFYKQQLKNYKKFYSTKSFN